MLSAQSISPDLSIEQLLKRWPAMAVVFLRHRMACVGCSLAAFDTLQEACSTYRLDLDEFWHELERAVVQNLPEAETQDPQSSFTARSAE